LKRLIGISTWVWDSPLTDANLRGHLARIAALGFDAVELPLENAGDFTADAVREALESTGLRPFVVGAMSPGRDLVAAAPATVEKTQAYLMDCITMAAGIGSPTVCGPFYARTGRVWRMSPGQRRDADAELRHNLQPVAARAREAGVVLGIEPLNRYETSLLNTVDQALEALGPLLGNGVGLALDSSTFTSRSVLWPPRSGRPVNTWFTSRFPGTTAAPPAGTRPIGKTSCMPWTRWVTADR
jgi:D-psicose/D-tagatose/L-ribulose 3-epimerase